MKPGFVDSSCLVAMALGESAAGGLGALFAARPRLLASTLLEAEVQAALCREGVEASAERMLSALEWIHPARRLTAELVRVFEAGSVRGADAWHLATALYVADPGELDLLTLDEGQGEVARRLGFRVLPG